MNHKVLSDPFDFYLAHPTSVMQWLSASVPLLDSPDITLKSLETMIIMQRGVHPTSRNIEFEYNTLYVTIREIETEPYVLTPNPNPYHLRQTNRYNYELTLQEKKGPEEISLCTVGLFIPSFEEGGRACAEIRSLQRGRTHSGKDVVTTALKLLDKLAISETVLYDRAEMPVGMQKIACSLMMTMEGRNSYYTDTSAGTPSQFQPCWGEHLTLQHNEDAPPKTQKFIQHPKLYSWAVETIQNRQLSEIIECYPESKETFRIDTSSLTPDNTLKAYLQELRAMKAAGTLTLDEHQAAVTTVFNIFYKHPYLVHMPPETEPDRQFLLAWNIVYNTTVFHRLHPQIEIDPPNHTIEDAFPSPCKIDRESPDLTREITIFLNKKNTKTFRIETCFEDSLYPQKPQKRKPNLQDISNTPARTKKAKVKHTKT